MNLFSILLVGHLIGDFPFQTPTILRWKGRGGIWILPHIIIHAIMMMILIENPLQHWPMVAAIAISHFIIDWVKVAAGCKVGDGLSFMLDQSAHILILWLVTQIAGVTSHQFTFDYLPLILGLLVMSAVFMYLNVIKGQMETMRLTGFVGKYAFYISKAAGWTAALSLLLSLRFLP